MVDIAVTKVTKPGVLPDESKLGFGKIFADHMFVMDYSSDKGWYNPRVEPYQDFSLSPAAMVYHYGQAIFEGMKVFRTEDDRVVVFRPQDHLNRLNHSAEIICIPPVDVDVVYEGLAKLIEIDKHWVPKSVGTALYIRPFIISTDAQLGVHASHTYKLIIITSPVGAYYAAGLKPVKLKVEDKFVRAVSGGIGEAKTPGNYAASLRAGVEAQKEGFDQVLWLDGIERKYIEEVGAMNILFKIKGEIVTPALNGSILSGITRKSVLEVVREWGMPAVERRISIDEVFEAHAKGELEEVFGSGTAAVISPVGQLTWKGQTIIVNNNEIGETSQKLYNHITGLQYGKLADKHGWVREVTKL